MNRYKVEKAKYREGWDLIRSGTNIDSVIATYRDEEVAARLADQLNDFAALEVEA